MDRNINENNLKPEFVAFISGIAKYIDAVDRANTPTNTPNDPANTPTNTPNDPANTPTPVPMDRMRVHAQTVSGKSRIPQAGRIEREGEQ